MATALEEFLHGLNTADYAAHDPALVRIRAALREHTTDAEAQSVCEELVRSLVGKVGTETLAEFGEELSGLTEVQDRLQALYDAATSGRMPGDLAGQLRPLQERRAQLLDQLAQLSDPRGIANRSVDLGEAAARIEEGLPTTDLPEEDRSDLEDVRPLPGRPRASATAITTIRTELAQLIPPNDRVTVEVLRPSRNQADMRNQFRQLRALDPNIAGRGYEVRVTVGDFKVDLDGLQIQGHRFRILEGKYTEPGMESIYGPSRGGGGSPQAEFHGQIRAQLAADRLLQEIGAPCDGITVVVSSEAAARDIASILDDMSLSSAERGRIQTAVLP